MRKIFFGIMIILILIGSIALSLCFESDIMEGPKSPVAELHIEKEDDFIITITSISFDVPSENVTFHVFYKNSVSFPYVRANTIELNEMNLISNIEPEDDRENITYYDKDNDNHLSDGDYFVVEADWDGPDKDGNDDGIFDNDGPIEEKKQEIKFSYIPTGYTIGSVYFLNLPDVELTVIKNEDYIINIQTIEFNYTIDEIAFSIGKSNNSYTPYVGPLPDDYPEHHPGGKDLITNIEPDDPRINITFYDNDNNKELSIGDTFVLEADWDGPLLDGNKDGDFTNDGPVIKNSIFRLSHELGMYTFAWIEIV